MPFADALKRLLFAALRHTECAYYFQLLKDELPFRESADKLYRDKSLGKCYSRKLRPSLFPPQFARGDLRTEFLGCV